MVGSNYSRRFKISPTAGDILINLFFTLKKLELNDNWTLLNDMEIIKFTLLGEMYE